MPVFHGDRYEDPEEFINFFLQCTKTGDDKFKARMFINYIQAYSVADEWYEDLPEAGKKDWEAIEASFYERWPKKKVISTNGKTTEGKEPHPDPITPQNPETSLVNTSPSPAYTTTSSTITNDAISAISVPTIDIAVQTSPGTTENAKSIATTLLSNTTPTVDVPIQKVPPSVNNDSAGPIDIKIDIVAPNIIPQPLSPLPAANYDATPSKTTQYDPTSSETTVPTVTKFPGQPPDVATSTPTTPNHHPPPPSTTAVSSTTTTILPQLIHQSHSTYETPAQTHRTSPDNKKRSPPTKAPNASLSPPHFTPNDPISPQPPPNTSTTPITMSTTLETTIETSGFTQKRPKTLIFDQNHTDTPKPLVLDKYTMDFRAITTNGVPFSPATYCDEEIARVEPQSPPIHDPPHLSVATSPLPALVGYVSSAQINGAFKNPTTDGILEPTTPVVTTNEPSTLTVNTSTPENATTTGEFDQKPPKPPETASILTIRHPKIIANDVPTSGKDPPLPQSPHYNMFHSLLYIMIPLQIDVFICFRSLFLLLTHFTFIYHLQNLFMVISRFFSFVFSFVLFPGGEDATILEGGTWSSASLGTPPSHIT
jgi:hypothetical protein